MVWDTCKSIFDCIELGKYRDDLKHWLDKGDKSKTKTIMEQIKADIHSVVYRFGECTQSMKDLKEMWIWRPTAFSAGFEFNGGK